MFGLFRKKTDRITVLGEDIFIDNGSTNRGKSEEVSTIIKFSSQSPYIRIYENKTLIRTYHIEPLNTNPDLSSQFFHCSIRVSSNSTVMIDGIISKSETSFLDWTDPNYEAVRLQPFFLSDQAQNNLDLKGKGLFERGLHFKGTVTPSGVRSVCICDDCNTSFSIVHFHAGFSEVQYFYSTDGKQTLIVDYNAFDEVPAQLQKSISESLLRKLEEKLPATSHPEGRFKYYNPFRCPKCGTPFIDFQKFKEMRSSEYYGNAYINEVAIPLIDK